MKDDEKLGNYFSRLRRGVFANRMVFSEKNLYCSIKPSATWSKEVAFNEFLFCGNTRAAFLFKQVDGIQSYIFLMKT